MAPKKKVLMEKFGSEMLVTIDEPLEDEGSVIDIASLKASVLKEIGLKVFEPETRFVLKMKFVGSEYLHRTMGTPIGLPYGKIYEISGPESHGKSVLQKLIEGEAQKDGAVVIHVDAEESDDPKWNTKLGVDNDQLIIVKPKMIEVPLSADQKAANKTHKAAWNEKPAKWKLEHPYRRLHDPLLRPQTAEEIFEETEKLVEKLQAAGVAKMVIGVDSLANLSTQMQLEAGTHTNMRTNSDFPMFLSQNLKRWQTLASNFNIMVLLINQIREKPGVMFGDPTYEPGGRALRHNCASRNRARRAGDGKIFSAGKLVGISGILKNTKNKSGEGSMEQQLCSYKVLWDDKPLYKRVTFEVFVAKPKADKKGAPVDTDE